MAEFYEVHRAALQRAAPTAERVGDTFRIIAWEGPRSPEFTIVTFRRCRPWYAWRGYEPATPDDSRAIAEWNARHAAK